VEKPDLSVTNTPHTNTALENANPS